ncbi:MAG: hypothetical protein AB7J35_16175 [Dehalococcoidia bacterium]
MSEEAEEAAVQEFWSRGPFWILALSPLVTVPLTLWIFDSFAAVSGGTVGLPASGKQYFFGNDWGYAKIPGTFVALLLPQVINLAPIFWLFAEERKTRIVAVVACGCGLLRFAIPLFFLIESMNGEVRDIQTEPFGSDWFTPGWETVEQPQDSFWRVEGQDGNTYLWYSEEWVLPGSLPSPLWTIWAVGALAWLVGMLAWGGIEAFERTKPASRPVSRHQSPV